MCISFGNPSEPCCDRPIQRCEACPAIDWSANTWLWEQPAAIRARDLQGTTFAEEGLGTPGTSRRYFARYAAVRQAMQVLESAKCTWFVPYVREATLGPGDAWVPQFGWYGDLVLRDFTFDPAGPLNNQFVDGWHSSFGVLSRVREQNTEQTANGWGFRVYYVLLFPGAVTAKVDYSLGGGSFNCLGRNRFDRNMTRELPSWLTADMFPEWITVSRIAGQADPVSLPPTLSGN